MKDHSETFKFLSILCFEMTYDCFDVDSKYIIYSKITHLKSKPGSAQWLVFSNFNFVSLN